MVLRSNLRRLSVLECVLIMKMELIRQLTFIIGRRMRKLHVNTRLSALRVTPFITCNTRHTFHTILRGLRKEEGQYLIISMGHSGRVIIISSITRLQINPCNGLRLATIRTTMTNRIRRRKLTVLTNVLRARIMVIRPNVRLVVMGIRVLHLRKQHGNASHLRQHSPRAKGRVRHGYR